MWRYLWLSLTHAASTEQTLSSTMGTIVSSSLLSLYGSTLGCTCTTGLYGDEAEEEEWPVICDVSFLTETITPKTPFHQMTMYPLFNAATSSTLIEKAAMPVTPIYDESETFKNMSQPRVTLDVEQKVIDAYLADEGNPKRLIV